MTFDEALAEWVRRNIRGSDPIVGSVEFYYAASAWGGELTSSLIVDFRELHRPKRGRIAGEWQYGEPAEQPVSSELSSVIDMMQILRDIYEISTDSSATTQPLRNPSDTV